MGCGNGDAEAGHGPRLTAHWTGADTSAIAAPATAEWCDALGVLEIVVMAGDTGVGLAIFRRGGVEPGAYRIRPPDVADTTPPSAAIALRWFSQTEAQGFQSDSGELSLARAADGTLSGRFSGSARAVSGSGRLRLTGAFEELHVRPATTGCTAPPPRDTTPGVN